MQSKATSRSRTSRATATATSRPVSNITRNMNLFSRLNVRPPSGGACSLTFGIKSMAIYTAKFCSTCNTRLGPVKLGLYDWKIRSPLVTCENCKAIGIILSFKEWRQSSFLRKTAIILFHLVPALFIAMLAGSFFSGWGAILGVIPLLKLIYDVRKSNDRMNNPDYINILKGANALDLYGRKDHSSLD
jgi:hypothetical protein